MVLLDTAAVIHLSQENKALIAKIAGYENSGHRIRVPPPAVFELSAGSPPGIEQRRRRLLDHLESVPFTDVHAEAAGALYRTLKNQGQDIGPLDCMIAAVALVENELLLTPNLKHFSRVAGLKVEGY